VACHAPSIWKKYYIRTGREAGRHLPLNCAWDLEELSRRCSRGKAAFGQKQDQIVYLRRHPQGTGAWLRRAYQYDPAAAFFKLANIIPIDDAVRYMKEAISDTYGHKAGKSSK
jgi:pyruvate-ferredoxin/flavodoxin oxidoreductase